MEQLVRLARKARGRVVEFEWQLGEPELRRLREAVHSWGAPVQGRYKRFDAQMLEAINEALNEPNSPFVLKAPASTGGADSAVSVSHSGDGFKVSGHAAFDVVFGYGRAEFIDGAVARLGDLAERLRESVDALGWDVRRVNARENGAVLNALFGLALDYGDEALPPGPVVGTIALEFRGPFSVQPQADAAAVFDQSIAQRSGVYLVTVPVRGIDHVHYVGQTRRTFAERLGEHMENYLCGSYSVFDAEALRRGRQSVIWHGSSSSSELLRRLPEYLASFDSVAQATKRLVEALRFHLAVLDGDEALHNKVEGGLGRHFQNHRDDSVRQVFVNDARLPAAVPGASRHELRIASAAPIAGMPERLIV